MAEYVEEVNTVWGIDPTAAGRAGEEVQLHESRELSRAEESRAASSTSFQEVVEERDQIGLRERDRIYQERVDFRRSPHPRKSRSVPTIARWTSRGGSREREPSMQRIGGRPGESSRERSLQVRKLLQNSAMRRQKRL